LTTEQLARKYKEPWQVELREIKITEQGKTLAVRAEGIGVRGKIFQAVGDAIPSSIREL
jgi:hypothetical protein